MIYKSRHDRDEDDCKVCISWGYKSIVIYWQFFDTYDGLVKIYTKIYNTCPEAPRDLMLKRIVENQYLLAKEYYLEKDYKKAFNNARASIIRYPLLGFLFMGKTDFWLIKFSKLLKPYGLLSISFLKYLMGKAIHNKPQL